MKQRTIYIGLFLVFIIGIISLIGTFAIDSTITEGNSSKADYLFNITLGDRTNREIVIPSYDSKIVDIKISNPNKFNMSYLLYLEGVNSNISAINISDTGTSGVINSKSTNLIKVFIQNNSGTDITTNIRDIVGFETETLDLPSNSTAINKGPYYKAIVKSNNNAYGKVKPNIKLSTSKGTVKYTIVPNDGYQYKSTTCEGTIVDNILTISNITSNVNCEVVFEPSTITISYDATGGNYGTTTYTEAQEHTYKAPYNGTYKIELWGAQGGGTSTYPGGYGGYSVGTANLNKDSKLYINVGGQGKDMNEALTYLGGYNGGGGRVYAALSFGGEGGGATHIATTSGLLSTLSALTDKILIVSGGGGGGKKYGDSTGNYTGIGGSGGGYIGNAGMPTNSTVYGYGLGGSQTSGGGAQVVLSSNGLSYGSFGQGAIVNTAYEDRYLVGSGGGGGYYGGGSIEHGPAGGGSGYIGNSLLTDKYMYCYNCATSSDTDTKTYTTTNVSSTPVANYAKSGNGAARITLLSNFSNTKTYGTKYSNLPTPTRAGYTFDGWYTGKNGIGTKVTSDTILKNENEHTLYAKWVKSSIQVSYDINYDFDDMRTWAFANGYGTRFTINYSSSYFNNTISCAGASGWEIIYYPIATDIGTEYEITFDYEIPSNYTALNGYSGIGYQVLTDVNDSDNSSYSLATKYLPNSATTSKQSTSISFKATTSMIFFGFNFGMANDGTTTTIKISNVRVKYKNKSSISYNEKYGALPTPSKVGYTFIGWYDGTSNSSSKVTSDTILTNTNDHTLYARYTKNTYYITYDANGGTGAPDTQSFIYNSGAKISTIVPTRPGYTFLYWTYQGVVFNPGDAVPSGWGSFALTANWGANDTIPPTCSLSASGSNITASASDNVGLSYQGWDSSYSGDNSTTKDIAAGDHVFYVKDTAGNTNTCSISIKSTFPYQKEVQTETSAYERWSATGSCSCRGKSTGGGYSVVGGTCTLSGCSCPGGTSVYSNSCSKKHTGYYCTSGTLSGSKCIHTSYETRYACDSGYTQINNSWCYK